MEILYIVSYLGFNPGSKSFPTIRSCLFSYFHISLYMLISFRNLMTYATFHSIPSIFFMSLSIPCFLLSSFHWGQSCRKCFTVILWFPHILFLHFGGCSFLDIKYPWINLVCPFHNLLNFISLQQLLWVLFHSSIRGLYFLACWCYFPIPNSWLLVR